MALGTESASTATIDLDAGLEAALEDFGNDIASPADDAAVEEISSDAFLLDDEPIAEFVTELPAAEVFEVEPEAALQEVEMAPLEAGEADQFDDAFVELIEE